MKPAWDKLMEGDYGASALVGDVDCTAAGKPLCDSNGVKGFPTIKWGDPSALEDYKGGRDFDALDKFASENLKPVCSPANIDLCDDTKKAEIEKFQAMSADELAAAIKGKEEENETAESDFKKFVEGLQKQYEEAMKKKDDAIAAVKASGLGLMKAVKAHAAKAGNDEL
jgi:hypothetical protein